MKIAKSCIREALNQGYDIIVEAEGLIWECFNWNQESGWHECGGVNSIEELDYFDMKFLDSTTFLPEEEILIIKLKD